MNYLEITRTCIKCKRTFKEKNNICKFDCRGFHSGIYNTKNIWTCCGHTLKYSKGCIEHDHFDNNMERKELKIKENNDELLKYFENNVDDLKEYSTINKPTREIIITRQRNTKKNNRAIK